MIGLLGNRKTLCTGLSRRDLLHIGGLGAFGVGLSDVLEHGRAGAAESSDVARFGQAKSCILIYKYGSPPQHETYDPKPDDPSAIQGEMGAIPPND